MRLYHLCRKEDISGTSGTGHVADVAEFDDGTVVVRWMRDRNAAGVSSTTVFNSLADLLKVHGHEGRTDVELVVDTDQVHQLQGTAERLSDCLRHCVEFMNVQGVSAPSDILNLLQSRRTNHDPAALQSHDSCDP